MVFRALHSVLIMEHFHFLNAAPRCSIIGDVLLLETVLILEIIRYVLYALRAPASVNRLDFHVRDSSKHCWNAAETWFHYCHYNSRVEVKFNLPLPSFARGGPTTAWSCYNPSRFR